jgi:CBS domain-containing protein
MVKRIRDILTREVISVSPNTLLSEAVSIMHDRMISCLVILEDKKPVGIFTERDVVWAVHQETPADSVEIRWLMSKPVLTVEGDIDILEVYHILTENKVRHLVVVDKGGEISGVVTNSDIVKSLGVEYFVEIKGIEKIMTKNVVTSMKGDLVKDALSKMREYSISSIVVEEDGYPVGILTERDVMRLFHEGTDIRETKIEEIMSNPVLIMTPDTPMYVAVEIMKQKKVRRLVVVDNNGRVSGFVAQSDLIKGLESRYIDSLKETIRTKDLFADIMRHDLLSPAGLVRNYIEILLEGERDEERRGFLKTVEESMSKLIDMIENAALYSKLETAETLEGQVRDIGSIVKDVLQDQGGRAAEKNLNIDYRPRGFFQAPVNPLIENVFSNLISNAIKYSPEGERIEVDILDAGTDWDFYVKDRGEGVSDDGKEAVFERFHREEMGATKGSGLGLAITKRIVDLHGGRVWVEDNTIEYSDEQGRTRTRKQGSIFYVELPKS